jgi:hypothetical protein
VTFSGIIGIAIAGSVLANQLSKNLFLYAPDLPEGIALAVRQSVSVISTLPKEQQEAVIRACESMRLLDFYTRAHRSSRLESTKQCILDWRANRRSRVSVCSVRSFDIHATCNCLHDVSTDS